MPPLLSLLCCIGVVILAYFGYTTYTRFFDVELEHTIDLFGGLKIKATRKGSTQKPNLKLKFRKGPTSQKSIRVKIYIFNSGTASAKDSECRIYASGIDKEAASKFNYSSDTEDGKRVFICRSQRDIHPNDAVLIGSIELERGSSVEWRYRTSAEDFELDEEVRIDVDSLD